MSTDGEISCVISKRLSIRKFVLLQGDIVGLRIESNTFDVTNLTGTDTILPLYAHDQGYSGNVTKSQNEVDNA